MPIPVKLLYHCDYEDPGGVYERGLQDVPRCVCKQDMYLVLLALACIVMFSNGVDVLRPC